MLVKDLYDKVNQIVPSSQDDFLVCLNEGIASLVAKYGADAIFSDGRDGEAASISDELSLFGEWRECLLCYVVWQRSGDALRYERFETLGEYAYRTVWRKILKKKRRYRVPSWT